MNERNSMIAAYLAAEAHHEAMVSAYSKATEERMAAERARDAAYEALIEAHGEGVRAEIPDAAS